ncbi:hypothetical protein FKM82_028813 [Ascaphus truei]
MSVHSIMIPTTPPHSPTPICPWFYYVSLMYGTTCFTSLKTLSLLPLTYQSELRPIGNHDNGCNTQLGD